MSSAPSPHATFYPDGSLAFDPTPIQADFLQSPAPWLLLWGNRGGGKSVVCRWRCHLMAMMFPGFRYLVIRNTLGELKRTHFVDLPLEMEKLGGTFHRTDNITHYPNGSTGTWVGVDDEKAMMKMLSGEYALIFFDEITTISWETVVDVSSVLRVRVDAPYIAQIIAATNPYGPYAEDVRRHFITKDLTPEEEEGYEPDDFHAIPIHLSDNPHLEHENYQQLLRKQRDPRKRAAWLDGEWMAAGSYFSNFAPAREGQPWHVIYQVPNIRGTRGTYSLEGHPWIPVYRALDWGFSDDPAVCLWIAVLPNGRAIVIKERTWKRTPAKEVAQEIVGLSQGMRIVQTFCDPSMYNGQRAGAQAVADLFEQNGVPLTPSVNDREGAGDAIHEYLGTVLEDQLPKIQFWSEMCPQLIRTIPMQKGHKLNPARLADGNDHYVIALSYFCRGGVEGQPEPHVSAIPAWMRPKASDRHVLGSESVKH